eukprot:GHVU01088052.1.p1 GENE.GHVU01088052.1~~GHVU01088052.1.p1  ORF type:complete len:261 (-),score=38.36 GHVU01088052.1:400-1182(-)
MADAHGTPNWKLSRSKGVPYFMTSLPQAVDTELLDQQVLCHNTNPQLRASAFPTWTPSPPKEQSRCLLYYKPSNSEPEVNEVVLAAVQDGLRALNEDCKIFRPDRYTRQQYLARLCHARFMIVVTAPEVQPDDLMDAQSMNVPLLIVGLGAPSKQRSKPEYSYAYICPTCGKYLSLVGNGKKRDTPKDMANTFAKEFSRFQQGLDMELYTPREFVQENLSFLSVFLRTWGLFCTAVGLEPKHQLDPIYDAFVPSEAWMSA